MRTRAHPQAVPARRHRFRVIQGGRGNLDADSRRPAPPPPIAQEELFAELFDDIVDDDPTLHAEDLSKAFAPDPLQKGLVRGRGVGQEPGRLKTDDYDTRPGAKTSPGPDASLIVVEGPGRGRTLQLPACGPVILGRSSRCEITLRDLSISRKHAELRRTAGGGFEVRDLGSRNGIAVDNRAARGWTPIDGGQILAVGDIRLRLVVDTHEVDTQLKPRPESLEAIPVPPPARPSNVPTDPPSPAQTPTRTSARPALERAAPSSRHSALKAIVAGLGGLILAIVGASVALSYLAGDPTPTANDGAVDRLIARAARLMDESEWDQAKGVLSQARAVDPTHPQVADMLRTALRESAAADAYDLAERVADQGRYRAAVKRLKKIAENTRAFDDAIDLLDMIEAERVEPKLTEARALIEKERFTRAEERILVPLLKMWPGHSEAKALLEEARAGRRAYNANNAAARQQAEAERKAAEARSEAERKKKEARRARSHRRVRRRSPKKSTAVPARSSANERLLADARAAFADGRVTSAKAAAEAADDVGVTGASTLYKQLRTFDRTFESAESTKKVSGALASYSEALYLAKKITPGGGKMAAKIRVRLAQLHYLAALDARREDKLQSARSHARKAVGYDSGHAKAQALLRDL